MNLLAVDTTALTGGLAVCRDGVLIASRTLESEEGLGGVLYPAILELLREQDLKPADIDVFAAASGPGSFTGIRVGLTAVKALAEPARKPVVPLTILEALASVADVAVRAPVLDGRRGQVFAAAYDAELRSVIEPAAREWKAFRAEVEPHEPLWIARDAGVFLPEGAAALPAEARRLIVPRPVEPLARLAYRRFQAGAGLPPERVEAAYFRRSDAERNWRAP